MTHHLARQMKQAPAHGRHLVVLPVFAQDRTLEQDEQIVGDNADAKESGIGRELPAGHALHAKADLQFFDLVPFSDASLAIPDQSVFGRFCAVDSSSASLPSLRS